MSAEFENLYDQLIENELQQENTICAALYARAYDVRMRIGARLGTDADDLNIVQLVELHEAIQKELCRRLATRMSEE